MTEHDTSQQLTLLPSSDLPVRFHLDAATRRRGMQHIAEIRQHLTERQKARAAMSNADRPIVRRPSHPTAA
jgi:hypothetical protein